MDKGNTEAGWQCFSACRAVACDLDGTLYLGGEALPGAAEFLARVQASGRGLFYFTNNSSKSRSTYLKRLGGLGFPAADPLLITSTDCAVSYLQRERLGHSLYLLGNADLRTELQARGFACLTTAEIRAGRRPDVLLLAFDTELTYEKLCVAYDLILAGVPYLATHADRVCPLGRDRAAPDAGSFIALLESATGGRTPKVLGKPESEAVRAIQERSGQPAERIAFVGDRLYTDIRMAARFGMLGVLALSGETRREQLATSPDQPHLVVNSVRDLIPFL
jgi:HAD superfamily hydrolase (TIGR01450 family)